MGSLILEIGTGRVNRLDLAKPAGTLVNEADETALLTPALKLLGLVPMAYIRSATRRRPRVAILFPRLQPSSRHIAPGQPRDSTEDCAMHSTYAVVFRRTAAALMTVWLGACQTPESPTPNPEKDRLRTLGHTYFRQARYRDALAAYQQAVALDSLSAEAHCHLATAYMKLGRRDSAETAYLAAIRLDSSLVLAYHNLAVAYGEMKRHREAVALLEEAVRIDPGTAPSYRLLAGLHQEQGAYDRDEILSYRGAVIGSLGGIAVMTLWLWIMGTPLWVSFFFIVLAMMIFIGITRIIAEAGLATLRTPVNAPDFVVMGLGSSLVGPTGVFNMSMAYIWADEVRSFAMATCTNALKLIEDMDARSRRLVFIALILALLVGTLGSFWMIFHVAYRYGGVNLDYWFFKMGPAVAYDNAVRNLEPAGIYWPGIGFLFGGGGIMALLYWARHRLPWWPLHPIGFPVAAVDLMPHIITSVFVAWLIKVIIVRCGGVNFYQRTQGFFLGMIAGQMLTLGLWLIIDYFTGRTGNFLFSW